MLVTAVPSYLIVTGDEDAAKPVPVTVTVSPTYPLEVLTDPPDSEIVGTTWAVIVLLKLLQLRQTATTVYEYEPATRPGSVQLETLLWGALDVGHVPPAAFPFRVT